MSNRNHNISTPVVACLLMACASNKPINHPPPPSMPAEEAPDPTFGAKPKKDLLTVQQVQHEPPPSTSAEPEPYAALPTCVPRENTCFPPVEFTQRLCASSYPGVSISMLEKNAGWARGYIRVEEVKSVNTFGGPASESKLTFGEEVVILQKSGHAAAVQVSGGGYVVLRWDGTCATLAEHELVTWVPGVPRHAPLVWSYIDTNIQQALLSNRHVEEARKTHRKTCRGGKLSERSAACVKATDRLNETVVMAVRTGIPLPTPEHLP